MPARPLVWLLVCALLSSGCAGALRLRGQNVDGARIESARRRGADVGLERFLVDDFGNLDSYSGRGSALLWKLHSTALLLAVAPRLGLPIEAASLQPALERHGFLFPDAIANADASLPPRALGQTAATMRLRLPGLQLEARTVGCASCHAGTLHDAEGRPTRTAWLGAPNASIDFQAFGRAILAGLRMGLRDERGFLATVQRVHPDLTRGERLLYRHAVMPRLRRAVEELSSSSDPRPFDAGGPGLLNALAVLKGHLGAPPRAGEPAAAAFSDIPALWSRAFRSSLLADGAFAAPGEPRFRTVTRAEATPQRLAGWSGVAAFFTLTAPTLLRETGRPTRPAVASLAETLEAVGRLRPPPFPGPKDVERSARGRGVYARRCAECHGTYDDESRLISYPNRLVPQERWGTDATRWSGVDAEVSAWREARQRHPFTVQVDLARTGGYVAPLLDGVWLTAPYLHNGSVPTLYHLMHPDERPARFEVGSHELDYERMGIALEADADGVWRARPRRDRAVRDTSSPGLSNAGHRRPFVDMSEIEKADVLEFLKTL